jgi:hypothetical protein
LWPEFWNRYRIDPANGVVAAGTGHNPFVTAEPHRLPDGRWRGYRREWKLLDFDRDIADADLGWGAVDGLRKTVCYKNGIVGVAIVRCTGTRMMNTLHAYKSMYGQ